MPPSSRPIARRRWMSFSLRTLLLAVTLTAIVCAIGVRYSWQVRAARDWTSRGAVVKFHPPLLHLPERLAWYLRDIRSVDFSRRQVLVEDLLTCQQLPRLEALYLARCELTDPQLKELGRCHRIQRLALWGSTLHDGEVFHLAPLRQLTVLDIHDTPTTEEAFETLSDLPALRTLHFNSPLSDAGLQKLAAMQVETPLPLRLKNVSDAGLRILESITTSSSRIELLKSSTATDAGLRRAFQKLPATMFQRTRFELSGPQITADLLPSLPFEEASSVALRETRATVVDLAARTAGLGEQLNVGNGVMIHRDVTTPFKLYAPSDGFYATPDGDWLAAAAPHLRSIGYLSLYKAEHLPVRNVLRTYTSLRHVHTSGPLPTGLLEELAALPELESLHVAWNGDVPRQSLEPLARHPRLRRIVFTATPFTAAEIAPLGTMPALVELELHACRFDRSVLEALPNYTRLRGKYSRADGPRRNEIEPLEGPTAARR